MCKLLNISKSNYYYQINKYTRKIVNNYNQEIISAFNESRQVYGARKIKVVLAHKSINLSRHKIRNIMKNNNLISKYTKTRLKCKNIQVNNDPVNNIVNRDFNNRKINEIIVSDLTYIKVGFKWFYVCLLIDLYNREIVGYSSGPNKNTELVYQAIMRITRPLSKIEIFHTDRGNEFKNNIIDQLLSTFKIQRSLSAKGCPYDNAVAEATYKVFKTEFINGRKFNDLAQLELELFDYINWYNNLRIHGSLNYLSPVTFRKQMSI